ncbi:MAG: hypothetical protein HC906_04370 [Bacteroidales bacterium]|nr:hypothetical protein [Bacteroidales bacterium]
MKWQLEYTDITRFSGFFDKGDKNSLGVFLVMTIGFFLAKNEKEDKLLSLLPLIIVSIIGIVYTGSRTAFVSIFLVFMIFFFRNKEKNYTFWMFLSLILISAIIYPLIESAFLRFTTVTKELDSSTNASRIGKWVLYYEYMMNNPVIFLRGSSEVFFLRRAVHNFYLQVVYNSGLFFMIPILYQIIKISVLTVFSTNTRYFGLYYLLPFLFISMYVSDYGCFVPFILYVALNDILVPVSESENL